MSPIIDNTIGRNSRSNAALAQMLQAKLDSLPAPERAAAEQTLFDQGVVLANVVKMATIERSVLERALETILSMYDVASVGSSAQRQPAPITGETAALGVSTQLSLTLTPVPATAESVKFFINGVLYDQTTDYSVAIATGKITWLATAPIDIDPLDVITIVYEV